jgi:uncharacterized protein
MTSDSVTRVKAIFGLIDQQCTDELVAWYADDALMELPFAPRSMPKRYEGRDEIAGFIGIVREAFSSFSMTIDSIQQTSDPDLVIVEHHSDGVVAANGRTYDNRYVTFVRFDAAGKIAHWREYYDAGVVVRAFRQEEPT